MVRITSELRPVRFFIFCLITAVIYLSPSCKPVEQELKVKVETGGIGEVGYTFAVMNGKVVDTGDGNIKQHGFCFSTSEDPTIFDGNTQLGARSTTGEFSDSLLNLQSGTTYYVKSYAQASDEIYYGDQKSFTTLTPTAPVVAIESVGDYENDSVSVSSTITDDGGSEIMARGVCWSLEENPVIAGDHTVDGSGTGSYTSTITSLMPDTIYYIRAYATSGVATSYSAQHQVTTPPGSVSVTTAVVTGITMTGAVSGGTIVSDGGPAITARGVCWSTDPNPDISGDHTNDGTGPGSYSSSLTSLSPGTIYYVRAYAINASGTYYGNEESFTTTNQSASLPVVSTNVVSSVTETSAVSGGIITDDGGSEITARGVCWSTSHNPDLSDGFTSDGTGTGTYTSAITELTSNTSYYVRAYATNGEGTSYGDEESFTTDQAIFLPTLTTVSVTSITETSAISGGNITDDGGAEVTAKGVCWSTSGSPEITDDHTSDGTGTGSFTSSLTMLSPNTSYYVRAYATNDEGTDYGNEVSFTTSASSGLPTLTTSPATSITENSAVSGGNITDDGGSAIIAKGVCWSTTTDPGLSNEYTTDGTGTGSYASSITGLDPNTSYYVKAYATNGLGTAFGDEISFTTGSSPSLPTLTTAEANNISAVSARSGGSVTDDGGTTVIARGVCWNTTGSPDLSDEYTTDGSGKGTFTSTLLGLDPSTSYYVKAYATNSTGTEFGNEISFTTMDMGETVTDADGNVYETVVIGTQTWMAENLKVTHYRNGEEIPQLSNIFDWGGASEGAYCYYDNDIVTYGSEYGALYNWYVGTDSRGVCPTGWHVPSLDEWIILIDYAGGTSVAGGRLKEEGTDHWRFESGATNEYGFSALGGGKREDDGEFREMKSNGNFWVTDEWDTYLARVCEMNDFNHGVSTNVLPNKKEGNSIRCVKD